MSIYKTSMITEQNKQQIFAEIYNEYFPRLYKYTLYRVGDINAAEDLVSEVFEKVLVKYNTYDSAKGKFSTWLFTIADNTIINYYKKSSRFKKSMDIDKLESKCRLEDLIINRELKENLINAVMCLDERQRSIIALKFGACLNNRQIAQVMDITESNIGTILYRSLKKLKCILKKQDITY